MLDRRRDRLRGAPRSTGRATSRPRAPGARRTRSRWWLKGSCPAHERIEARLPPSRCPSAGPRNSVRICSGAIPARRADHRARDGGVGERLRAARAGRPAHDLRDAEVEDLEHAWAAPDVTDEEVRRLGRSSCTTPAPCAAIKTVEELPHGARRLRRPGTRPPLGQLFLEGVRPTSFPMTTRTAPSRVFPTSRMVTTFGWAAAASACPSRRMRSAKASEPASFVPRSLTMTRLRSAVCSASAGAVSFLRYSARQARGGGSKGTSPTASRANSRLLTGVGGVEAAKKLAERRIRPRRARAAARRGLGHCAPAQTQHL